ncbi:hypothetical protein MNBD_NITROSPINAE05-992 [hydrothermal vent metagenome]|uniref:Uncharacterized protein n=1 Tax=hydrothermal vent metagenome TaxID=652676 RepID=A0A3B1D9F3_9ZZZZ
MGRQQIFIIHDRWDTACLFEALKKVPIQEMIRDE